MMSDGCGATGGPARRRLRRYDEASATVLLERIAAGETLLAICREAEMPGRSSVADWARGRPAFGARLAAARIAGRSNGRGRASTYRPPVGALICQRLAEGMSLAQACDLPGLPGAPAVYRWLERHPDFARAYAQARLVQAHRRFDQVWEIAESVTPETVAAARVKIAAATWQAAKLAPKRYGAKVDEGEDGRPQVNVYIQKFGEDEAVLMDPQPGAR